jgi:L-fuculose-phosphate aldolase
MLNFEDSKDCIPSRALKSHFAIYGRQEEVNCIISSHPLNISVLCAVQAGIDTVYMPLPYSNLSRVFPLEYDSCLCPDFVASHFYKPLVGSISSLLIANDGAIVIGKSIQDAYDRLQILESSCSIAIDACSLGCQEELFLIHRP